MAGARFSSQSSSTGRWPDVSTFRIASSEDDFLSRISSKRRILINQADVKTKFITCASAASIPIGSLE
jgi:hypothetical protein